jgi:type IV pilus assembly protein PilV
MSNGTPNILQAQCGVVLIEVLVATLIFSIGILAVVGMQAGAIASVADAKYRVDAANVANQLLGSMWAKQTGLTAASGTVSELPNGNYSTTVVGIPEPLDAGSTAGYATKVTVSWQPPNSTSIHTFSAVASVYSK